MINYLRFHKLIKIVVINVILTIFLIAMIELIFGNWFNPNYLDQLNIIRNKVYWFKPKDLYPTNIDMIQYSRDEHGLRGNFSCVNSISIVTLGGSTTDQRYITDGETFQDVLQNKFKERSKNIYIANAGIDGQSTYGHIKNFEYWFPKITGLNPD